MPGHKRYLSKDDKAMLEQIEYRLGWSENLLPAGQVMVWDLDNTIANTAHRHHMVDLIREGKATWDEYSLMLDNDSPIAGSIRLMQLMPFYTHIAVSGSAEVSRDLREKWLSRMQVPVKGMLLRPEGDHAPNGKFKVRAIRMLQHIGVDVALAFEDWDEAADEIFAGTGVHVVGINPFNAPPAGTDPNAGA